MSFENNEENYSSIANICDLSANEGEKPAENISLASALLMLSKPDREKLISGYDIKSFAKIFEDGEMMRTADAFLQNGMNISKTARALYMHRNTLMYRLKVIYRQTGLDLKDFDMAVTFKILHNLYLIK